MGNYTVNYTITVNSDSAVRALNNFTRKVESLSRSVKALEEFKNRMVGISQTIRGLFKTPIKVKVQVKGAVDNLKYLQREADKTAKKLRKLSGTAGVIPLGGGSAKGSRGGSSRGGRASGVLLSKNGAYSSTSGYGLKYNYVTPTQVQSQTIAKIKQPKAPKPPKPPKPPKAPSANTLYQRAFGPQYLPNNGGMAIDMLKSMGIMYGISAAGEAVSEIVHQASEYDNLMTTVESILKSHDKKGNFSGRYSGMQKLVRQIGMKTKYTVTDVAGAAKYLAMAGMDIETINAAMKPISNIALVGDLDLADTADKMTNIMKGMHLSNDSLNWASDVITNTFTRSNTTLEDLAMAAKYYGPIAEAGGVKFEEAMAAIGVLGDAGIKNSQAGTSLRRLTLNIANPRGKAKQSAWANTGIQRYDAIGRLRPLAEIFKELNAKNYSLQEMAALFDVTAAPAAFQLTQEYEKLGWLSEENKRKSHGIASKLAEARTNNLQGLLAQAKSIFIDRGVTTFQGKQSVLEGFLKKAINYMGGGEGPDAAERADHFQKRMNELGDTMMEFLRIIMDTTKWFMKLFDIFKPMLLVWSKFQMVIWPVTKAFGALKAVGSGLMWLRSIPIWLSQTATSMRSVTAASGQMAASKGLGALMQTTGATTMFASVPYVPPKAGDRRYSFFRGRPMVAVENGKTMTMRDGTVVPLTTWVHDKNANGRWRAMKRNFKGKMAEHRRFWQANGIKGIGRSSFMRTPAVGMAAGGLASYAAMNELTKENGSGWAAGLYGAAAISAMIPGWGLVAAGVLAAGGAVVQYINHCKEASKATEHLKEISSTWKSEGGIAVARDANPTDKYLAMLRSGHASYDELLKANIEHLERLYYLQENPPAIKDNTEFTNRISALMSDIENGGNVDALKMGLSEDLRRLGMEKWVDINEGHRITINGHKYTKGTSKYIPAIMSAAIDSRLVTEKTNEEHTRIIEGLKKGFSPQQLQQGFYEQYLNPATGKPFTVAELQNSLNRSDDYYKDVIAHPERLSNLAFFMQMNKEAVKNQLGVLMGKELQTTYSQVQAILANSGKTGTEGFNSAWTAFYQNLGMKLPIKDFSLSNGGWLKQIGYDEKTGVFLRPDGRGLMDISLFKGYFDEFNEFADLFLALTSKFAEAAKQAGFTPQTSELLAQVDYMEKASKIFGNYANFVFPQQSAGWAPGVVAGASINPGLRQGADGRFMYQDANGKWIYYSGWNNYLNARGLQPLSKPAQPVVPRDTTRATSPLPVQPVAPQKPATPKPVTQAPKPVAQTSGGSALYNFPATGYTFNPLMSQLDVLSKRIPLLMQNSGTAGGAAPRTTQNITSNTNLGSINVNCNISDIKMLVPLIRTEVAKALAASSKSTASTIASSARGSAGSTGSTGWKGASTKYPGLFGKTGW